MKCRTPSSALTFVLAFCFPLFAAAAPPKTFKEQLKDVVQNGLQDDQVAALAGDDPALGQVKAVHDTFAAAKTKYKSTGKALGPDEIDAVRGPLRDLFKAVNIDDKGRALELTYLSQLAPAAAVDERLAQQTRDSMKLLQDKLPASQKGQYQSQIDQFNAAAAAGDWQTANTQFRSLYDNMKNTGGQQIQESLGQANIIARNIKPRPADTAVAFTQNRSAFEGGLKINNNIPTPYSADEVRKADAAKGGKHFGVGAMAAGGGILAWTGAAALGIVSAPAVPVILVGGLLIGGGLLAYKMFKGSEKNIKEGRPEDEQDGMP